MTYKNGKIRYNMLRRELEQSIVGGSDPIQQAGAESILAALNKAEAKGFKDRPVLKTLNPLRQTIAEYKKGVRTPELVTAYWRAKLPDILVPDCDWTEEAIQRPMVDIRGNQIPGLMVPDFAEITLLILGRKYPNMRSRTVSEAGLVTDTHNTRGWIKVYDSIDAPNRNTSKSDVERFAQKEGYLPGREKGYILGAQASKDFKGKYFDQGATWSWLLGSRLYGGVVGAFFGPNGYLDAYWDLRALEIPRQSRGWRFEEVKKA